MRRSFCFGGYPQRFDLSDRTNAALVSSDVINQKIFILRGHRVMISPHLAELYEVEVKALVQAVKRNKDRFPDDFCFQLTWDEAKTLKPYLI